MRHDSDQEASEHTDFRAKGRGLHDQCRTTGLQYFLLVQAKQQKAAEKEEKRLQKLKEKVFLPRLTTNYRVFVACTIIFMCTPLLR